MGTFAEIIDTFQQKIDAITVIEIQDIPNIDLYMDQVTTFMENSLHPYKRTADTKILTKTMINNYTKAKILPPPVKKKYSRMHIMLLIMIFHLKTVLSIKDIATLFHSILATDSTEDAHQRTTEIYAGFVALQKATRAHIKASASETQTDVYPERALLSAYDEEMKKIMLVLLLAIRANAEKYLTERVLDLYF